MFVGSRRYRNAFSPSRNSGHAPSPGLLEPERVAVERRRALEIRDRHRDEVGPLDDHACASSYGAYRLCSVSGLPSGSVKFAMWQTPVSNVSPWNSHTLRLELGARGRHVVDVKQDDAVRLRLVLDAELRRLPDREARVADPELVARVLVGSQPERVDVERRERSASVDGMPTTSTLLIGLANRAPNQRSLPSAAGSAGSSRPRTRAGAPS